MSKKSYSRCIPGAPFDRSVILSSKKPHKRKFALECIRQDRTDLLAEWAKSPEAKKQVNISSTRNGTILELAIKRIPYNADIKTIEILADISDVPTLKAGLRTNAGSHNRVDIRRMLQNAIVNQLT